MADIKAKSLSELNTWTKKELRKLRMTINNRISGLRNDEKDLKKLPEGHPLKNLNIQECEDLLKKVQRQEKAAE